MNDLALSRISRDLSELDIKFVVLLRDPYERLYSHYLDVLRSGRATGDIRMVMRKVPDIVESSRYADKLRTFATYFPLSHLFIGFHEEIARDPTSFVDKLCNFLKISPSLGSDRLYEKINPGRCPDRMDLYLARLQRAVQKAGLSRSHFKSLGLSDVADAFFRVLARRKRIPRLTDIDRRVICDVLGDQVAELRALISECPDDWSRPATCS